MLYSHFYAIQCSVRIRFTCRISVISSFKSVQTMQILGMRYGLRKQAWGKSFRAAVSIWKRLGFSLPTGIRIWRRLDFSLPTGIRICRRLDFFLLTGIRTDMTKNLKCRRGKVLSVFMVIVVIKTVLSAYTVSDVQNDVLWVKKLGYWPNILSGYRPVRWKCSLSHQFREDEERLIHQAGSGNQGMNASQNSFRKIFALRVKWFEVMRLALHAAYMSIKAILCILVLSRRASCGWVKVCARREGILCDLPDNQGWVLECSGFSWQRINWSHFYWYNLLYSFFFSVPLPTIRHF